MIALPVLLVEPAQVAGMKVPADPDEFDPEEFPHFYVFLACQLGASMPDWSAHWDNAKVVAAVSEDRIREVTWEQLQANGFSVGYPRP